MANPVEVARWVIEAGWTAVDATTATAIALRTSGGDPNRPAGLFGLGVKGDGAGQARVAHDWQVQRGWNAFPAYRDKSYLLLVPPAAAAVAVAAAEKTSGKIIEPIDDAAGQAKNAAESAATAAETVGRLAGFLTAPGAWERIVRIGIGSALVIGAVLYIGKRGTIDQGVRFLRTVADNAPNIVAFRGATAKPQGGGGGGGAPASAPSTRPKATTSGGGGGRHRAPEPSGPRSGTGATGSSKPPRKRSMTIAEASEDYKSPRWSNEPTAPQKVVARSKVTAARKLPGDSTAPRTGMWKKGP